MAATDFHDLAAQFCAAACLPAPDMPRDGLGVIGFNVRIQDVDITLTHDPVGDPAHAFVMAGFGRIPPGLELAALRELLGANLVMQQTGGPVFCRRPASGEIVLQYACALADASGEGLLAGLKTIAAMALKWQADNFMLTGDEALPASPPQGTASFA